MSASVGEAHGPGPLAPESEWRNRFGSVPEGKWTRQAKTDVELAGESSRLRMEAGTGLCAAALLASLYWILPPGLHGLLLLLCGAILVWVARRRSELLPVRDRAVLVTGNTRAPRPARPSGDSG